MRHDEGLSTKLWLENRDIHSASVAKAPYTLKKFKLKKSDCTAINSFLKKNHIAWNTFIHAAWGLLLCRLSTSDYMVYGTTQLVAASTKELLVKSPLSIIKCEFDGVTTLKSFIEKSGSQLDKKTHASEDALPEECRYLLAFKSGKATKSNSIPIDTLRFPLTLLIDKAKPESFSLYYHASFFEKQSIENLISHFMILLTSMVGGLSEQVIKLPLLSVNDSKKILTKWRNPRYAFPVPVINQCAHALFSNQAKKSPNSTAIVYEDQPYTYEEIDFASTKLAWYLIDKGLKNEERVCVFMDRNPNWIITFLAIFKAGGIYVPINPKYPDERLASVLMDAQPKFIIVNDHNRIPTALKDKIIIARNILDDISLKIPAHFVLPEVDPSQTAYIMYTSGTTGQPKGAAIRHASLNNLIAWYIGLFKINAGDRFSQFGSQGFDAHICEIAPALAVGAGLYIVDDNTKLTPSLFFDWLKKYHISICDLTTAYAQMLFGLNWPENIKLRLMKIGGEALTRYPNHTMPFEIWNCYGPTETTIEATYYNLHHPGKKKSKATIKIAPPIGKPIANSKVYVVDKYLQPVPIGVAGELIIGGIPVSQGYINQPELTFSRFINNPFDAKDTDKYYRTGDLVQWLPDGNLKFIGRVDKQIKIRGYRIELSGIENILNQHPDVNESIVIVNETDKKEKTLIAYIVPNFDSERYLYQERCLISLNHHHFIEALTEDISKGGIGLSGVNEKIPIGSAVKINVKLPGMNHDQSFNARLIWQKDNRCGFVYDLVDEEKSIISKCIDFHLSSHNIMELLLSASTKRSLRNALKSELPEYMIPTAFVTLPHFPLTFSGKVDLKALPPPTQFEELLQKKYVPPITKTEIELSKIWEELLHKSHISMTDNFFDLGGTSLTAAELSVNIMQRFNTTIPAKLLYDLSYVPILAEYIDTKGAKYNKQSVIQEEIARDTMLPESINPTGKLHPNTKSTKNILLTGAGGFLGVYFLRELLKLTNAKIYCLIRKGEFDTAAKRILSTIQKFNLGHEITLDERRIVAIPSDISHHNFGMSPDQYNSLAEKIDLIYHCGAQVNVMASYNKLRSSNVVGTLEIMKFATAHTDKPIHYISTLSSAYRKDESGSLTEVFPDGHYEELFGGYAISKWVSERLLTHIKDRGLPVTVFRSGYIAGQSDTGISNLNDALFMLIKGCVQLGLAPIMNEKITILPVDFVSKAIVQISLAYPNQSDVYHIDHPTGIMWTDLVGWLNAYGYPIQIISLKEWQNKLIHIPQNNALYPFLPYYLSLSENQPLSEVSVQKAAKVLDELSLDYPDINDALLTKYFDYMRSVDFLPPNNSPHKTSRRSLSTKTAD